MVLGAGNPVFRHDNLTSAIKEAERLANLHPGSTFTILKSIAHVQFKQVQWEEHESVEAGCDIPF